MNELDIALFDPAFWWDAQERWCFDTRVKPDRVSWSDIAAVLSEHVILEDKESAHMVGFQQYLPPDEAVETKEWRGHVYTKKMRDNVVAHTALAVDFDDGWTIEDAIAKYAKFEFVLATSHSHQAEGRDRFRMVFPMPVPLPVERLAAASDLLPQHWTVMPELRQLFRNTGDDSWTDSGRAVFLPSCPPERQHLAQVHHNNGAWFDWRSLDRTPGTKKPRPPMTRLQKLRLQQRGRAAAGPRVNWRTFDLYRACADAGIVIRDRGKWTDIECPWKHEHTNATAPAHSSIRFDGERWVYCCVHRSHGKKTARDLREWLCQVIGDGHWRNMVGYCDA